MNGAVISIKVFAVYVALTGAGLLLVPASLLSMFGIASPADDWVRVVGVLAIVLGYYYWRCGAADDRHFIRASVGGRFLFAGLCLGLVVMRAAPPQLLLFAAVDVAAAQWTRLALRKLA